MQHAHEDPLRTTPIGMARYACEFMEAALAADEKMGATRGADRDIVAPIPVMFLVGQSIELALKAIGGIHRHVVAQVIKSEFVIGAIGDIGRIRALFVGMIHLRQDDPHRQT